jgi:hypothetical protein
MEFQNIHDVEYNIAVIDVLVYILSSFNCYIYFTFHCCCPKKSSLTVRNICNCHGT